MRWSLPSTLPSEAVGEAKSFCYPEILREGYAKKKIEKNKTSKR
jgi:hypothetical protein